MTKKIGSLIGFIALVALFTSCLTIEKKVYTFEMKDNNSGTLTIKYVNIMSIKDDNTDVSEADFEELISEYIDGNKLESDYPGAVVKSKRLFEENGELCGEVIIEFTELASVGLYQYDSKSPYMFNIGSFFDSESYLSSNGEFGGDVMPVIFWPRNLKTLTLTTLTTTPDESTVGLVSLFRVKY
ncbi:MAG: hypothetical protein ACNA7V_09340 [Bacteroidales bacterium]